MSLNTLQKLSNSGLGRYGFAVLAVALASLMKLALVPVIGEESPFLLFFGAVMLSALIGGWRAGLLATALALLSADYLFFGPYYSFEIEDTAQAVSMGVFAAEGTFISVLAALLHSAQQRSEASVLEARENAERFRLLVEGVKEYAIFMLDPGGRVASWNAGAERIKGYTREEILGEHISRFYTEEDVLRGKPRQMLEGAASKGSVENESWRVRKDGSRFWASVLITALRDEKGTLIGFSKVTRDLTERRRAEDALRASERGLSEAQRIAHIGDWDYDIARDTGRWSDELYRIFGLVPGSMTPSYRTFLGSIHPGDREAVRRSVREAIYKLDHLTTEYRIIRPNGEVRHVQTRCEVVRNASEKPLRLVGTIQDISERKALEDQLAYRAFHDLLTGLPNRTLLMDRLGQALLRLDRKDNLVAALFMDLDNFKLINDSLGHDFGDKLLKAAGDRLEELVRSEDTVARLGGDEFVVMLEEIDAPEEAVRVAERIVSAFEAPFTVEEREISVSASIGIAVRSSSAQPPQDLLREADAAMYQAKHGGKARFVVFAPAPPGEVRPSPRPEDGPGVRPAKAAPLAGDGEC